MKLIISTHNVTYTKAIDEHIASRIEKLEHMDHYAINARVILEHDKLKAPERQFTCSMRLSVPGPDLFAEDSQSPGVHLGGIQPAGDRRADDRRGDRNLCAGDRDV